MKSTKSDAVTFAVERIFAPDSQLPFRSSGQTHGRMLKRSAAPVVSPERFLVEERERDVALV